MMNNQKCIESLLDGMVESQWNKDIIKQEYERLNESCENEGIKSAVEDLEPISQYSKKELKDCEFQQKDFNVQLENFYRSDYENYLISHVVDTIAEDEYFEEIEFSDDYLENLIRRHLDEEDFLNMAMKEAIAEDDNFQDYIEQYFYDENPWDYPKQDYSFDNNEDVNYYECPQEKDLFDDLGDTSYMDQGIYKGANTDILEEPFQYSCYEQPFFDDDLYYEGQINDSELDGEIYMQSGDFIDVGDFPDDLILEEPADDNMDWLVKERLFEEKYLDRIFIEIIKKDKYWDSIIKEKLASDNKFRVEITDFS